MALTLYTATEWSLCLQTKKKKENDQIHLVLISFLRRILRTKQRQQDFEMLKPNNT